MRDHESITHIQLNPVLGMEHSGSFCSELSHRAFGPSLCHGRIFDRGIAANNFSVYLAYGVRRHIICPRFRPGLRETLLTFVFDFKRRLCGIASVDARLSFV